MFEFQPNYFFFTSFPCLQILLFLHHVDAQASMEPVPTYITEHNWEPSIAITVGAILCALLFMGIIAIYFRNCAESRFLMAQTNALANRSCSCSQGINKDLLSTFPTIFYSTIKDLKTGKGPLECAVCLTDFKDDDTLRLLPKCSHVFHPQCIDSWLASHVTCPVCRANLNQDACQVAITVPTHLSNDQMGAEAAENRAETHGDEGNQVEPNPNPNPVPVVHNMKATEEGNSDDGVASKPKLLRSNSTGHLQVEPVKCVERYTLRLPEDVRRYILVNHDKRFQRSASCYNSNININNNEGSNVGKSVNGEERMERWVICTPPFVAARRG